MNSYSGNSGVSSALTASQVIATQPYESATCLESMRMILDQIEQKLQPVLKPTIPVPPQNSKAEVQMESDLILSFKQIVSRLDVLSQRINL